MRTNLPVTQREVKMREGTRLITTTGLKGVITYCNDDFVEISGFREDELVGQAHNIIRHPDMPSVVFKGMWDTLQAGKPWMGVVKNRSKSGDHYWVSAYVTPVWENGQKTGYESVRTAPTRDQVARAEKLYRQLSAGKSVSAAGGRITSQVRAGWPMLIPLVLGLVAVSLEQKPLAYALVVAGVVLGALIQGKSLSGRLRKLIDLRPDAFRDPTVARTYTDESGSFAELAMVLVSDEARVKTALARIEDQADTLLAKARETYATITEGTESINRQRSETDQAASAINEMTASIQEVAETVTGNAKDAEEANQHAARGSRLSSEALESIEKLVARVNAIGETIGQLGASTASIGEATQLISDIADQTNLLALNAAIEAARAGEQGRGFAVVADEVRSLAGRTRQSTVRIQELIDDFRKQVDQAIVATEEGGEVAGEGLKKVQAAEQSLQEIVTSISRISDSFIGMSAAFEEQSQVSDEINRQVVNIADLADTSTGKAGQAQQASDDLSGMSVGLRNLVARFVGRS